MNQTVDLIGVRVPERSQIHTNCDSQEATKNTCYLDASVVYPTFSVVVLVVDLLVFVIVVGVGVDVSRVVVVVVVVVVVDGTRVVVVVGTSDENRISSSGITHGTKAKLQQNQ